MLRCNIRSFSESLFVKDGEAGALGSVARLCGVGLRAIPSATRSYYASDTENNHKSYTEQYLHNGSTSRRA